jgi:hypothetical protein
VEIVWGNCSENRFVEIGKGTGILEGLGRVECHGGLSGEEIDCHECDWVGWFGSMVCCVEEAEEGKGRRGGGTAS